MADSGFLSSLLDDAGDGDRPQRMNWRAISGIGLALAIGAAFWAGLGLLISRIV